MAKDTGDGAGTAARRQSAQRGPRGPRRRGQDHPRRGAAGRHRRAARGPAGSRTARPAWTPRRSRSASSARSPSGVATVEHAGHRITLLDTPGSPDFVGELRAGLRAADAALFVVSAVNGVDAATVQLWEECAAVGMPRAVVITQLDRARADVDDAVRLCQLMLGEGVYPVHLVDRGPDGGGPRPGVAARPRRRRRPRGRPAPRRADRGRSSARARTRRSWSATWPATSSSRPTWSPTWRPPSPAATSTPCCCVAPLTGVGVPELLELLVAGFPCPMEHGCPPVDPARRLARRRRWPATPTARWSPRSSRRRPTPTSAGSRLVRVFSGTLRPGHPDARLRPRAWPTAATPTTTSTSGSARSPRRWAHALRPVAACPAGDICAVARLTSAETGDTLSSPEDPRLVPPWDLPTPQLPVAVEAASRADEDRLATALAPARRRGPDRAAGAPPRHRPAAALVRGGGARRGAARAAAHPARRRGHDGAGPRADGGDPRRPGPGHRPARQAVRRARPVRRRRGRGRARAGRVGHRLRAADRRRHRAQPVPRQRGEGHPHAGRARASPATGRWSTST